jgi:membrane-bound ClpP family serine protease
MEGHITLGSTLVVTVLTLYFSFKAGTWKKMALNTTIDSKVDQLEGIVIKDGDSGKSVSRLAPSGKAIINNEIVEVHTFGEFIDQEVEITVISVKDNKIFVTLKKSNS